MKIWRKKNGKAYFFACDKIDCRQTARMSSTTLPLARTERSHNQSPAPTVALDKLRASTALANQLIGSENCANTARAYQRDLHYFWQWAKLALAIDPVYPIPTTIIEHFLISHTLAIDTELQQQLIKYGLRKSAKPYQMSSIDRFLASLSVAHQQRGLPSPMSESRMRVLRRKIKKRLVKHKKPIKRAITSPILLALLETCDNTLIGLRDKAILLIAFSTGGRRRSELADFTVDDVIKTDDGYSLRLKQSKNDPCAKGLLLPVKGQAAEALARWLKSAKLTQGKLFRAIDRHGHIKTSLSARAIHWIVTKRLTQAGFNRKEFCAHSLRTGFMTEAARHGVALGDAMQLSAHKTPSVAMQYYRTGQIADNPATRLLV